MNVSTVRKQTGIDYFINHQMKNNTYLIWLAIIAASTSMIYGLILNIDLGTWQMILLSAIWYFSGIYVSYAIYNQRTKELIAEIEKIKQNIKSSCI